MVNMDELLQLPNADLQKKFEESVAKVRDGPPNPNASNADKLKIYGLFKQAKNGDNNESAPWAVQLEKKAKWDAWNVEKGKTSQQAMAAYIAEVDRQMS